MSFTPITQFQSDFAHLASLSLGGYTLAKILPALFTLIIGLIVIRIAKNVTVKLLKRTKLDSRIQKIIGTLIKLLLYIVTILIIMDQLGIPVTSLVALLSVAGLAVSLAVESVLSNAAGGLMIYSAHPFEVGDYIEMDGKEGTVVEIGLNHTKIDTYSGQRVLLPNKSVSNAKVVNYNTLGRRRTAIKVTTHYDAPTQTVKKACMEAVEMVENRMTDPAPAVYLSNYGSSSIEYTIYCWATPENYWGVYFGILENLRTTFEKYNVEMSYDHLNVHLVEDLTK